MMRINMHFYNIAILSGVVFQASKKTTKTTKEPTEFDKSKY